MLSVVQYAKSLISGEKPIPFTINRASDVTVSGFSNGQKKRFYEGKRPTALTIPESPFDDHPVTEEIRSDQLMRISVNELLNPTEDTSKKIINALLTNGFFALSIGEEFSCESDADLDKDVMAAIPRLFEEMTKFFTKPESEKEKYKEIFADYGYSGYLSLQFDNDDSRRDPERRDIYEMHFRQLDEVEFPTEVMKRTATTVFKCLFSLSCHVLTLMEKGLKISPSTLLDLIQTKSGQSQHQDFSDKPVDMNVHLGDTVLPSPGFDPRVNPATNFCLFRYQDDEKLYKNKQSCMVHQDGGLVTLLPRASYPGLEVFDRTAQHWIPIEKFTKPTDILVFPGIAIERMTLGFIPATIHRVIREPGQERFSSPFELKPNNASLIPIMNYNNNGVIEEEGYVYSTLKEFKQYMEDSNDSDNNNKMVYYGKHHCLENYVNPLWVSPAIHFAVCDVCETYISCQRFKCIDCNDYDMCSHCIKNRTKTHNPDHHFEEKAKETPLGNRKPIKGYDLVELINARRRTIRMWRNQIANQMLAQEQS